MLRFFTGYLKTSRGDGFLPRSISAKLTGGVPVESVMGLRFSGFLLLSGWITQADPGQVDLFQNTGTFLFVEEGLRRHRDLVGIMLLKNLKVIPSPGECSKVLKAFFRKDQKTRAISLQIGLEWFFSKDVAC
jgi:hypothetical protein